MASEGCGKNRRFFTRILNLSKSILQNKACPKKNVFSLIICLWCCFQARYYGKSRVRRDQQYFCACFKHTIPDCQNVKVLSFCGEKTDLSLVALKMDINSNVTF